MATFKVKDKKTGVLYSKPSELIKDTKLNVHPCLFDMGSLAVTTDGELLIIGNCNEVITLDKERFELF